MLLYFSCYVAVMSVIAFLMYGADKMFAVKDMRRISEAVLLLIALVGGSIGALLGMIVFRHKTRHLKFQIGVPVILLCQLIAVGYIWIQLNS
ncbi:DUF1294 domain-containing protein [Schwartzia succinivorans]|jgi:uncharacterized membrane protein YsdA (DUF1294 family)|uniref:Uncharacterized membrane protein YsdA, DUF1294 family n=1 Tax=Schwartzia succinivorans DSM 10502 TaxID=1123243 RepID=A0A1M4XSJ0_9FIRM|nr:DUF1294 domain-containing protein [Schwartzia succinivorans]SHE96527.1 Uncharacterized membrane protein YsdA, DUF1294 family [Schwartzia succinivorans DSM 10502]